MNFFENVPYNKSVIKNNHVIMIKDFNIVLDEREINTILYALNCFSESTQEYTAYNDNLEYSVSLKEKFEEIIG